MILIGTTDLTRKVDAGNFYCPHCDANENYQLKSVRSFLTLYFIPIVPLSPAEQFVLCDHCKSRWDPSVLDVDMAEAKRNVREQFAESVMRASVLVVATTGHVDDEDIDTLLDLARDKLGLEMDRDDLGLMFSQAHTARVHPVDYLTTISRTWNQKQKAEAVETLFLAASTGGEIEPSQMEVLMATRQMFAMTDQEYERCVEAALGSGV